MNKSLQELRQSFVRFFLKAEKAKFTDREGLTLVTVESQTKGLGIAKQILYLLTEKNPNTVLFLSGGKTPEDLYRQITEEARLKVEAVAMVDERFGPRLHNNSNERMIGETGFWSYLEKKKISFYSILRLHPKGVASDFVRDYDRKVKYLLGHFSKKIAVLGIGKDGHTAGIAPNRKDFINPLFSKSLLVGSFKDHRSMDEGGFGTRITLTFEALRKMDILLVLAFGEEKKEALRKMFNRGSLEEIPARFYTSEPQIVQRTILITDQKV
ncbi:MAG: 6-phosphogluconolactonase [Candidatus Levybacteria bacterium]|nr:6-phosphogluconolactonase [Candidatus Levybacteria bacterium]